MKKLLSLLSILTISVTAISNVIASSNYEKNDIKDLSKLNWTDLNTNRNKRNVNNKNKPIFKTNGIDKPTEQQIKNKLKELNPQLDITKIKVEKITNSSATVAVIGYNGKKIIDFKVDKSFELKSIIKNTNLDSIITNETELPKEQFFKDKLKELNPQLDITKIKVEKITNSSATISFIDNTIYSGTVNITYIISLKSIIKNTNLGSIITNGTDKPTEQQIKYKLKEKNVLNKNIDNIFKNIEISNIKPTSAQINYKYPNIYADTITVNFTYNINLNKIINHTDLGEFITSNLSNPFNQQIKDKLKELNPQLDITKIKVENITNSSATITSTDNTIYSGNPINVIYTVSVSSLIWQ